MANWLLSFIKMQFGMGDNDEAAVAPDTVSRPVIIKHRSPYVMTPECQATGLLCYAANYGGDLWSLDGIQLGTE